MYYLKLEDSGIGKPRYLPTRSLVPDALKGIGKEFTFEWVPSSNYLTIPNVRVEFGDEWISSD